ncbi:MAG: hypothetical protein PGN11_16585 [Quadrisphaera sp.]
MEAYERSGLHFDVTDVGPDLPGTPAAICLHGFPQDRSAFDDVAHRPRRTRRCGCSPRTSAGAPPVLGPGDGAPTR